MRLINMNCVLFSVASLLILTFGFAHADPISTICPGATGNKLGAVLKTPCLAEEFKLTTADDSKDFTFSFDPEDALAASIYVRALVGVVTVNIKAPAGFLALSADTVEGPAILKLTPDYAARLQQANSAASTAQQWTLHISSATAYASINVEVSTSSATTKVNAPTRKLLQNMYQQCCSSRGAFNGSTVYPNTPCWQLQVWTNATTAADDVCQDDFNTCSDNGKLQRLVIGGSILQGSFVASFNPVCLAKPPVALAGLVDLNHLEIVGANLSWVTTDLWTSIGKMTKLQRLYLGGNRIRGKLDAAGCAALKNVPLQGLSFKNKPTYQGMEVARPWNSIHGIIDACWFSPTLEQLNLALNQIEGVQDIPAGNNSPLKTLQLQRQALDDDTTLTLQSIPRGLIHLKNLSTLMMGGNEIVAAWPELPGTMEFVDMSDNRLIGSIQTLSMFPNLRLFNMRNNPQLEGDIESFGLDKLVGVRWLDLTHTSVKGNLNNTDFSAMKTLQLLGLSSAKFVGAVPPSLATLPALSFIDLSNNTGITSQQEFGNALTNANIINYYDVSSCAITDLPDGLYRLEFFNSSTAFSQPFNPYVKAFDIHGNQIQMVMPAWMVAPFQSDDEKMLQLIPSFYFRYAIQAADSSPNEENRISCPFRPLSEQQMADALIMQSNILYPLYGNCWNGTQMAPVASYVSWLSKHGAFPAPPPLVSKYLDGAPIKPASKDVAPEPKKKMSNGMITLFVIISVLGLSAVFAVLYLVRHVVLPRMRARAVKEAEGTPSAMHPTGAYPTPDQFMIAVQQPAAPPTANAV